MRSEGNAAAAIGAGTRPGTPTLLPVAPAFSTPEERAIAREAEAARVAALKAKSPFAGKTFSSAPAPVAAVPARPKPVARPRLAAPTSVPEWPAEADEARRENLVKARAAQAAARPGLPADEVLLAAFERLGSIPLVAAEVGVPYERVRRQLAVLGIRSPRGGRPRNPPSPDVAARIVAAYRAGGQQDQIAAEFGCTRQSVLTALREAGVSVRGRGQTQALGLDEVEVVRLYVEEGLATTAIAAMFGCSHGSILRILIRHDVPRRVAGRPSPAKAGLRPPSPTPKPEPVDTPASPPELDLAPSSTPEPADAAPELDPPLADWELEYLTLDDVEQSATEFAAVPAEVAAPAEPMPSAIAQLAHDQSRLEVVARLKALTEWLAGVAVQLDWVSEKHAGRVAALAAETAGLVVATAVVSSEEVS